LREPAALKVGVLSDTHGLLRPEARSFLTGCDYIVHGGDIGNAHILADLRALAPLIVVRGNNDDEPWARKLRESELFRVGGLFLYAIHDLKQLLLDPAANGVRAVISGHSHKPKIEERAGVLYVNPGSCGPRRFNLPISIGEILVQGERLSARTVELPG
jgi:uncharacterized protein